MEYIWHDRKRHLGLPISFTKYRLTTDRLFCETGVLNLKEEEILLYRVRDIGLTRTFWQRLFRESVIIRSCTQHEQTKVVTNLPDHIQTLPAVKKFIQTEEFHTLMNSHIIMVNKHNPFGATFKPEPATVEDGTLEPANLINRAWFDAVAYAYEIYALGLASKPIWPGIYLLKKEVSKKTKLTEFTYAVNSTVYRNALLNALALCKKNGEDAVGVRFADSVCAENMSRNPSNYQVITVTKPIQNHPLF